MHFGWCLGTMWDILNIRMIPVHDSNWKENINEQRTGYMVLLKVNQIELVGQIWPNSAFRDPCYGTVRTLCCATIRILSGHKLAQYNLVPYNGCLDNAHRLKHVKGTFDTYRTQYCGISTHKYGEVQNYLFSKARKVSVSRNSVKFIRPVTLFQYFLCLCHPPKYWF